MQEQNENPTTTRSVTELLSDPHAGRPEAQQQLLELVYAELRRIAAAKMAREKNSVIKGSLLLESERTA